MIAEADSKGITTFIDCMVGGANLIDIRDNVDKLFKVVECE